jgi:hypothetical protein
VLGAWRRGQGQDIDGEAGVLSLRLAHCHLRAETTRDIELLVGQRRTQRIFFSLMAGEGHTSVDVSRGTGGVEAAVKKVGSRGGGRTRVQTGPKIQFLFILAWWWGLRGCGAVCFVRVVCAVSCGGWGGGKGVCRWDVGWVVATRRPAFLFVGASTSHAALRGRVQSIGPRF